MRLVELEIKVPEHHQRILNKYGMQDLPENLQFFDFVEKIKADCMPYLKSIDYAVDRLQLLRGVIKTTKPYIHKRVRLEDRTPKDTPEKVHNWINEYFIEKFGQPFRNSMFATADYDQANEYATGGMRTGATYVVFPTGDFQFIWSPRVGDLLDEIYQLGLAPADLIRTTDSKIADSFQTLKTRILKTYVNTDIKKATASNGEVMIRSEAYYGIKWPGTVNHWLAMRDLIRET